MSLLPQKKQTRPPSGQNDRFYMGCFISKEWLQLGGFTQGFTAVFNRILAL
jgi:hypothetical protein